MTRPTFAECFGHLTYHPVKPGDTAFCNRCGYFIVLTEDFDWELAEQQDGDPTGCRFFFMNRPFDEFTAAERAQMGVKTQREIEAQRKESA